MTERGITDLLRELATESSALIRGEIVLAKLEAREMARSAGAAGVRAGVAAVLGLLGAIALMAAAILGLGALLGDHYAWAALLVGAALCVAGFIAARSAKAMIDQVNRPAVIESVKEDKRVITAELKGVGPASSTEEHGARHGE